MRRKGVALLDSFLMSAPFSSAWSTKDALGYLGNMREQLNALREREAQIRADLALFGLSLPESPELAQLEKELQTLELVWLLADEWEVAWESYKSGEFWTIQTEEMEEKAQTLFRKLTRLARELKEKGWEIVEHTRSRVDAFRRTLPLLADLKNPAMRERHWDRVRTVMGVKFDQNSPEFNLEAIIAMQMQKYAEDINEISNAATMELLIEKGLEAIAETWKTMEIEMAPHKDKGIFR